MLHEKGITILLAAMGPPKPDDGFYTSLVCENYGILVGLYPHQMPFLFLDDMA